MFICLELSQQLLFTLVFSVSFYSSLESHQNRVVCMCARACVCMCVGVDSGVAHLSFQDYVGKCSYLHLLGYIVRVHSDL